VKTVAFNSIKETASHISLKVATSFLLAISSVSSFAQAAAESASASTGAAPAVEVSNPYGLGALWETSDSITKTVLLILLIMSVGSWYIIATKFLQNRKFHAQSLQTNEEFWKGKTIKEGASHLDEASPYRFIAESGSNAVQSHVGMKKNIPLNDWLEMNIQSAVDRIQNQTQSGLSFLATVGSTSPFVGLFGTVWGIYHALTAIGISGQASIDKVAGPVGEALIMTAIGLAVAIPAVLGYNWLAKANKAVMDDVREFSEELNGVLVGSSGSAA
jgi:biopolymer transport protein ExbB